MANPPTSQEQQIPKTGLGFKASSRPKKQVCPSVGAADPTAPSWRFMVPIIWGYRYRSSWLVSTMSLQVGPGAAEPVNHERAALHRHRQEQGASGRGPSESQALSPGTQGRPSFFFRV